MSQPLNWAVWSVLLPLLGAAATFVAGPRAGRWIGPVVGLGVLLCSGGLALDLLDHGAQRHDIGRWGAPLGIALVADGLSAVMLLMTAVVGALTGLYAAGYLAPGRSHDPDPAAAADHHQRYFWPLWLFMWAALNALYLSGDLFNIYVTLELLGLSAVPLVALAGGRSLAAAMRYLLVSMLGSLTWLFGVALVYGSSGVLDLDRLSRIITAGPAVATGVALMTGGMLMKTALFPLHFWLPPAHASAPAPVSALLSAVVVKATFYLVLRLWTQVFPAALAPAAGQLLAGLGAAAVLWGSVQALRQRRLKLLLAYSTVSQIGYFFLVFALPPAEVRADAASTAVLFVLAHAFSKAALFLASGNILLALGHDDIDRLGGAGGRLPVTLFAFGVAGVNLMGLPPSGGFIAKWRMLTAATQAGAWGMVLVLTLGGLLAAAYLLRVLAPALMGPDDSPPSTAVPAVMEWTALTLAVLSVLMGFLSTAPLTLLEVGAPFSPRSDASP